MVVFGGTQHYNMRQSTRHSPNTHTHTHTHACTQAQKHQLNVLILKGPFEKLSPGSCTERETGSEKGGCVHLTQTGHLGHLAVQRACPQVALLSFLTEEGGRRLGPIMQAKSMGSHSLSCQCSSWRFVVTHFSCITSPLPLSLPLPELYLCSSPFTLSTSHSQLHLSPNFTLLHLRVTTVPSPFVFTGKGKGVGNLGKYWRIIELRGLV